MVDGGSVGRLPQFVEYPADDSIQMRKCCRLTAQITDRLRNVLRRERFVQPARLVPVNWAKGGCYQLVTLVKIRARGQLRLAGRRPE